jgi:hypothetical protein
VTWKATFLQDPEEVRALLAEDYWKSEPRRYRFSSTRHKGALEQHWKRYLVPPRRQHCCALACRIRCGVSPLAIRFV